ncbi:hypothetical protein MP228_012234 [Amoeboaphelidium protococcarum]|nr:hypothetical protein MP228_012234 [Amoeboaphelidium protococcarum]
MSEFNQNNIVIDVNADIVSTPDNQSMAMDPVGQSKSRSTDPSAIDHHEPITLSWSNVSYSVDVGGQKKRTLLQDVSGIVKPGEVVAIMGASGAGKSTLLNVLAGRIGAGDLSGEILVNGRPRNPSNWRNVMAFVEQDDLLFDNLTVKETILYSARLRLPSSAAGNQKKDFEDKKRLVDDIIQELSLTKCQDTKIGGTEKRGISGGERKRVSIAVELITQPKLLFLDEPTSGLDAFTASNIVSTVKKLAVDSNRAVIMTIHQPREYILTLFDKLILLSEGKTVYFGPVQGAIQQFQNCGFSIPPNTNPADFFLDLMTIDMRSEKLKQESIERNRVLQEAWQAEPPQVVKQSSRTDIDRTKDKVQGNSWANSFVHEYFILLERNVKDVMRDKITLFATIAQGVINAIIIGFIFFRMDTSFAGIQNRIGSLFLIIINQTFGNVMPVIAVFTLQKAIVKKERAAGTFRAISAYLAKISSQIPLALFGTLVFCVPIYWMLGLQATAVRFFTFVAILCLHTVVATLLGIAISSGAPSVRVGQSIAPLSIIVFMIFAGQLVNVDSVTVVLRWIKYTSFVRYSYSAIAVNEFSGLNFECPTPVPGCVQTGQSILDQFSLVAFPSSLWYCLLVNAGIAFIFLIGGYLLFELKSRPLMRLK